MKRFKQVKTRLLLFLISGILLLSIGLVSCGTGPQTKTTVPDRGAYAVDFSAAPTSGDNQPGFISLSKSIGTMAGLTEFTIEAWVKPNTTTLNGAIFSRGTTGGSGSVLPAEGNDDGILLYVSNNQPGFAMALNTASPSTVSSSGSPLTNGSWTHIAVVLHAAVHGLCSSPHLDIYLGGTLNNCANATSPAAFDYNEQIGRTSFDFDGGNLSIGVQADTKLKAVIDEVRFWKEARTVSEIQTWMNKEITETNWNQANPDGALIGYWRLNEGAGTAIYDASGTGNGGVKNYCDSDCAGTSPTSILWDGGWVAGKLF